MKHDMTQPITDLSTQCKRCGQRWTHLQIIQNPSLIPGEEECSGFSLRHWFWRKKQNFGTLKACLRTWPELRKHMNIFGFIKVLRENVVWM